MKKACLIFSYCLLAGLLAACEVTQEELNATVTSIAADVVATQTAMPTSTPTPIPASVRLAADGSGDYATLQEAVQGVPEGGVILIGPGTYRLPARLAIHKPVRLVGAGMQVTTIVCDAESYVIRFSGSGPVAAEDITFQHEGRAPADVVIVEGGQADFSRCRFTGAIHVGEEQRAGLRLQGDAWGTVRDCVFEGNDSFGVYVADQAQPTVEWNLCTDNDLAAIAYDGQAGGLARRNESSGSVVGIRVGGRAQPTLDWNLCTDNEEAGIAYLEDGGGLASGNECLWNLEVGIRVAGRARPTLEDNLCHDNLRAGIAYLEEAGGEASRNSCMWNGTGISVSGQAQPRLEENLCRGNVEAGIAYTGEGGGECYVNECLENGRYGIRLAESADPDLAYNDCRDNLEEDILDERE